MVHDEQIGEDRPAAVHSIKKKITRKAKNNDYGKYRISLVQKPRQAQLQGEEELNSYIQYTRYNGVKINCIKLWRINSLNEGSYNVNFRIIRKLYKNRALSNKYC